MLILSRVSVEFRSRKGIPLFTVTPDMLNTFQEAPESIQEDPIFDLLLSDGSLEAVVSKKRQKELENDPVQDTDASGKKRRTGKNKDKEGESALVSDEAKLSAPAAVNKKASASVPTVTVTKDSKVPENKSADTDASDTKTVEKKAAGK